MYDVRCEHEEKMYSIQKLLVDQEAKELYAKVGMSQVYNDRLEEEKGILPFDSEAQGFDEDGNPYGIDNLPFAKGGKTDWVQSVVDSPNFRKGAFTKKAKAGGMTPTEFMKKVLANPSNYNMRTRRQAQFMKNI